MPRALFTIRAARREAPRTTPVSDAFAIVLRAVTLSRPATSVRSARAIGFADLPLVCPVQSDASMTNTARMFGAMDAESDGEGRASSTGLVLQGTYTLGARIGQGG